MTLIETASQAQDTIDQLTARVTEMAAEHAAVLAAKQAELNTLASAHAVLTAYQTAMQTSVAAVLSSGDPAQYEALATEFLTPVEEKARLAKVAQLAALQAEAAALEAELNPSA